MIDLETLSTNPNAVILTIGGVKFNPYTSVIPSQGMYFKVDVDSQQKFAAEFGVRNIPTVLVFNKGELVNRQVGVAQKSVYADFLNSLI